MLIRATDMRISSKDSVGTDKNLRFECWDKALTEHEERRTVMKSLIKKIAVLVFVLVVMVSTASTVLAGGDGSGNIPWPGWDPPPGEGNKPNGPNSD
jgi:hypothetical protein